MHKTIRTALLSVYHKDGLDLIINELNRLSVKIYATGGTFDFIKAMGVPVEAVEDVTGYPSILDGRVKTLHPAVFGGILAIRDNQEHQETLIKYNLPTYDLVVVDLYPFEDTVASGANEESIIEKIDVGGISLIRAAAKNFNDVVIIPSVRDYSTLLDILKISNGPSTESQRKQLAFNAFGVSSSYDGAINQWFGSSLNETTNSSELPLRYGENPHQKAVFKGDLKQVFEQLHGKDLSYNNLLDVDAALSLITEFDQPTVAVIKHNNACGCASADTISLAWDLALAGDPVSAFGGVIVSNKAIDEATAEKMNTLFFEILMAPDFSEASLAILKSKKNRIILKTNPFKPSTKNVRSVLNGVLEQDADLKSETSSDLVIKTTKSPSKSEVEDLVFANKLVKHSKSNAIILAKNNQLLASGVGQTSRVDALKQAIAKATSFGFKLEGSVMASDAFFPFTDCIEIAHAAGVTSVIQPGGSIKDQDVINSANELGLSLAITGIRHFKH